MRRNPVPVRPTVLAWTPVLLTAVLLNTGCAGPDDTPSAAPASSSPVPHGYVEGAEEAPEQQSRLLIGDAGSGATRVLDLITGKVVASGKAGGIDGIATDGRFGYLPGGAGTKIVDTGAWTVDHGDHVHYYRAKTRTVGDLAGGTGARVHGDAGVTVVTGADGRARVLRRADLDAGRTGTPTALTGTYAGAVVPYAEHLVAVEADPGGDTDRPAVVVLDRAGRPVASPGAVCEDPRGEAVTRRGVVLGCADGALLVREDDGRFTAERIPYGRDMPRAQRAAAFRHRPGSTTLTAPAGKDAVWALDVTARTWKRIPTGPVVAVNTAGEGSPLLVLESDGALHSYDSAEGRELAVTARLVKEPGGPGGAAPVIEIDRSRAYLNDAEGRRVHEIDYLDDLRVARTFDLDLRPSLMVETGR